MVSSTGAGFSSFSSSMRSDPRAFLRMAALAFPSRRRCVRVRRPRGGLALSSWGPSHRHGEGSRPVSGLDCIRGNDGCSGGGLSHSRGPGPRGFPLSRERRPLCIGFSRERRMSWAQGERGWLGCYGPRRPPGFPLSVSSTGRLGYERGWLHVLRAPPPPWVPAPYRVRGRLFAGTTVSRGSG